MKLHEPVMVTEVINNLLVDKSGKYADCTFGLGGHSKEILNNLSSKARLYAIDRDPYSASLASKIAISDSRVVVINDTFSKITSHIKPCRLNGALLDLGISSFQLNTSERGFSFQEDGPLDMRMNPSEGIPASQWLNIASQKEIEEVLWMLGEERASRKIAKAICKERSRNSFKNTKDLADLISSIIPRTSKRHPATNSFRAIRMFINKEIEELRMVLEAIAELLLPGGRFAIISFHSMEDRIAKRFIQGKDREGSSFKFKLVGGKPFKPERSEVRNNPRARSAILRIGERLA
jgi:16S rRNA (cytosine1402-N4)-methyltransferase